MGTSWLSRAWLVGVACFLAGLAVAAVAEPVVVRVDAGREIGTVPRRLFGTGVRQNMESGQKIRDFLKETGITLFRYPDAVDGGYAWDWDKGGVMVRGGKPLISGLAKFDGLAGLAKEVGADVFFTINIHSSTADEQARWVAEAKKRGLGGGNWCFGNEPYFKASKDYVPREKYAEMVNAWAPVLRKADPSIKLGVAIGGPFIEEGGDKGRDSYVIRQTAVNIDFIDFHFYTGRWEKAQGIDPKRIVGGSLLVADHTRKFREMFKREAPAKAGQIEIQYWEWNGPCWPEVGGLQTQANAVFAADALGEMARNKVASAIQYNLQEHACGLIPGWEQDSADGYKSEPWNGRTVRPIAYAIQLWSRVMGPKLVEANVSDTGSFETKDWHTLVNYQGKVPAVAAHATRSADGGLRVMVINRDPAKAAEVKIEVAGLTPAAACEVWRLDGPGPLSHNDVANREPKWHSFKDAPEGKVKLTKQAGKPAGVWRVPACSVMVVGLTGK